MEKHEAYIEGAKKLLLESLKVDSKNKVVISSTARKLDITKYFYEAAKRIKRTDFCCIIIPNEFRPMDNVPSLLIDIVKNADAFLHIIDRMASEDYAFFRPLREHCIQNKVPFIFLYDTKLSYLAEGINADYNIVDQKTDKIKDVLEKSSLIKVTSTQGTSLSFELYKKIITRSPYFKENQYWIQSPEGEVMTCPIENSFNGNLVINETVTIIGKPKKPITFQFEKGKIIRVDGDKSDLQLLLEALKSSDPNVKLFEGMYIAEFALGTNDWAKIDDNISNCEKVSGTVHFGIGQTVAGIGIERGEKFHFDVLNKDLTVDVEIESGESIRLVESGKLLI